MENPELSIILLNYNNSNMTIDCLKCLKKQNYINFEIIIVENNSNLKEKKKLFSYISELTQNFQKKIQIIENDKNYGFAKGNNIGIRYSGGKFILLLNSDTEFESNFLQKGIRFFRSEKIDIMSPKIIYFHNKIRIWNAGGSINFLNPSLASIRGAREIDRGQYDHIINVDYASGCCFFIKRKILDQIGLLDDDYFMYYEETDLCKRAYLNNFNVIFNPFIKIYHKAHDTASEFKIYLLLRNKFIFLFKFFPIIKILIQFMLQPLQIFLYAFNRKTKSLNFTILKNCVKYIFLGIQLGILKRFQKSGKLL